MNIGIDIGGTNIGAGLMDEKFNLVYKIEVPTCKEDGYDFLERKIISIILHLGDKSREMNRNIQSIGIGIPGIADKKGENVIYCPNLHWRNVPLGKNLRKKFNIEVNIENDATLAGIAENALGESKGYNTSVFITIGTGIGGGLIVNNKVYTGAHGIASEIGHLIVGENFYNCNCGNNGCLETFASSTAMEKYVVKEINDGYKNTMLLEKVNNLKEIDGRLIFQCAKLGDKLSNMAVNRMVKYITIGIVNIINTLDPGIIVLGGGVARSGNYLLDKINKLLPTYILFKDVEYGKVKISKIGNDAGIIGAALLSKYK